MSHSIEPRNRFFDLNRAIVEYEIRPGNTVTFISEVDLTEIRNLREQAESDNKTKPSYTAIIAKAVAIALSEFPYANRRVCRTINPLARPRLQQFEQQDIAIAVERDVEGAEAVAFVDVLRNPRKRDMEDITKWLRSLATADIETNEQWRSFNQVVTRCPRWLARMLFRLPYFFPGFWTKYRGASVLISSPAKYGVDSVVATWSWPLGVSFGLVKDRPVAKHGRVEIAPTFNFVLNFDRRVMAGAQGARFFKRIVDLLESPAQLHNSAETTSEGEQQSPSADAIAVSEKRAHKKPRQLPGSLG